MDRRTFLWRGGGLTAALALSPGLVHAAPAVDITMAGRVDGSKVWFDPCAVLIRPGQTVRWRNTDKGNAHTATAYHPDKDGRSRRIPMGTMPFDSGFMLPGDVFEVTLSEPGVYDYYCVPHEMAGMVGRIVVASPGPVAFSIYDDGDLPQAALAEFAAIGDIVAAGAVHCDGG